MERPCAKSSWAMELLRLVRVVIVAPGMLVGLVVCCSCSCWLAPWASWPLSSDDDDEEDVGRAGNSLDYNSDEKEEDLVSL